MSANIEALVKKHIDRDGWSLAPDGEVASAIRNALTEQAEAFKGELQSYDGMVRELTKTVEDMQAAQSVPVVGEVAAWMWDTPTNRGLTWTNCTPPDADAAASQPLYRAPTHSITAAELATLREKAAEADELRKALLALKEDCQTSNDCQYGTLSTSHVARIVDAAIAQGKGE